MCRYRILNRVTVCPEPAVDVDGLEVLGVAALVLEVALPAAGVHRADVVWQQGKVLDIVLHRTVTRSPSHLCASSWRSVCTPPGPQRTRGPCSAPGRSSSR